MRALQRPTSWSTISPSRTQLAFSVGLHSEIVARQLSTSAVALVMNLLQHVHVPTVHEVCVECYAGEVTIRHSQVGLTWPPVGPQLLGQV